MSLSALVKSIDNGEILLPELRTFLLKERGEIDSGKLKTHDIVIADAKMARRTLFDRIVEYQSRKNKIEGEFFHPSALGTCMRQVWYDVMGAPSKRSWTGDSLIKDNLILEGGTYTHIMFQNLCERAGILESREVAIMNRDEKIIGHGDGILRIRKWRPLLEIKTINSRRFTMLGNKPQEGHKKQVMAYMKCLGLNLACIIYLEKDTHRTREYVVPYDEGYYQREVATRIDYFFRAVRKRTQPPREGANPKKFPCTFCSYERICWETKSNAMYLKAINAKGLPE